MKGKINGSKHFGRFSVRYEDITPVQKSRIVSDFFQWFNAKNSLDYSGSDTLMCTFCLDGSFPWHMRWYLKNWVNKATYYEFIPNIDSRDYFQVEPGYLVLSRTVREEEISDLLHFFFNRVGKNNAIRIENGRLNLKLRMSNAFCDKDEILNIPECDIVHYEGIDEGGNSTKTIETFEVGSLFDVEADVDLETVDEVESPAEEVAEAPTEEDEEAPAEEVEEVPAEEVAETPSEEIEEAPAEEVEEAPVEEVEEAPAEEVEEAPAEEVEEASAEEISEVPAENQTDEQSETATEDTPDSEYKNVLGKDGLHEILLKIAEDSRSYEDFAKNVAGWISYNKVNVFVAISKLEREDLNWKVLQRKIEKCTTTDQIRLPAAISEKCQKLNIGKIRFKAFMLEVFKFKVYDFSKTKKAANDFGSVEIIPWVKSLVDKLDTTLKFEAKVRKILWVIGSGNKAFSGELRDTLITKVTEALSTTDVDLSVFEAKPNMPESIKRVITILDSIINEYHEKHEGTKRITINEFLNNCKIALENHC